MRRGDPAADESMVLTCNRCRRSYAWTGDGCPHCGLAEWSPL